MKDIATLLGVSVSTVGRALADRPEISDAMKLRVRVLAEQHGYIAHSAARAMRTGHSSLIGLIVPDIRNDFYSSSAMALAKCCEAAGFQLVLAATQDDPDSELRQVRSFIEARVAGVVIAPSAASRRETMDLLARVPTVELIREVAGRAWFGIDDRRGIETATRHLLDLGHRDIAYIGGEDRLSTGRERLSGFRSAFQGLGLDAPANLMRLGAPDTAFGESAFADIWSAGAKPTALVTAGADLTAGALDAIGRLGVSVPEDLSVVGFGDAPLLRWWGRGLTTMALPVYDVAFACGNYLLRQIRESLPEDGPAYRAMHAPTLVVPGSTRHV